MVWCRRLRAFAAAFRDANAAAIAAIAAAAPAGSMQARGSVAHLTPLSTHLTPLSMFRDVAGGGRAFADVAVQVHHHYVHHGDAIGEGAVAWHVDAANSMLHIRPPPCGGWMLHMAVALRGQGC
eukprot:gene50684-32989_t